MGKKRKSDRNAGKPPSFTKYFYDLYTVEGQPAEFKFKYESETEAKIQWFINKIELPESRYEMRMDGDKSVFTLLESTLEDTGKIMCKVSNSFGFETCISQLNVMANLSKPKILPSVPPRFVSRFSDVDVNFGFEARYKCKVVGEPIPTVTWFRNGRRLPENSRYNYEDYGEIFLLIIENAEPGDRGEYTALAKNVAGEDSCSAKLSVTKVDIPMVRKGPNNEMKPQFGYAPVFTCLMQDCDGLEDGECEFVCRAYGMPDPKTTWCVDDVAIKREGRFQWYKDSESSDYHFLIRGIELEDAGQYTCKLANFAGKASCSAALRVKATRPRPPPVEDSIESKVPRLSDAQPIISDKKLNTITLSWVPAMQPIKEDYVSPILYSVDLVEMVESDWPSRKPVDTDWSRAGSKISEHRYIVHGLKPDKVYLFRVQAENEFGPSDPTSYTALERRTGANPDARKLFHLLEYGNGLNGHEFEDTGKGPLLPADRPTALDIRAQSVRLTWLPAYLPERSENPINEELPEITYIVEMRELPGQHWIPIVAGIPSSSFFVQDLQHDQEYSFRVRAQNLSGCSAPTFPIDIKKRSPAQTGRRFSSQYAFGNLMQKFGTNCKPTVRRASHY